MQGSNYDEPSIPIERRWLAEVWLDGIALELWNELEPILSAARVLTIADRTALALLCDDYQRVRTDPDDFKARDRVRRMLCEFGLTPSSRSRIRVEPEKKAVDPLDEFLERKA